jgi:hypothetical protein
MILHVLMAASVKIRAFWIKSRVVSFEYTLMMEAVRTSDTSVCSNESTRRYIPEGSNPQFL